MAEQESRRNPVRCIPKGHEEVPWCTTDSVWSKELWNHPASYCRWMHTSDRYAILKRWAENFDIVFINDNAINRLPQVECNILLDEFPTVTETTKVIKLLSSGKAPGSDTIPADIYEAGGQPMAKKLTELFHYMWRKEAIPQEFKDASIIHLLYISGREMLNSVSTVTCWEDTCKDPTESPECTS